MKVPYVALALALLAGPALGQGLPLEPPQVPAQAQPAEPPPISSAPWRWLVGARTPDLAQAFVDALLAIRGAASDEQIMAAVTQVDERFAVYAAEALEPLLAVERDYVEQLEALRRRRGLSPAQRRQEAAALGRAFNAASHAVARRLLRQANPQRVSQVELALGPRALVKAIRSQLSGNAATAYAERVALHQLLADEAQRLARDGVREQLLHLVACAQQGAAAFDRRLQGTAQRGALGAVDVLGARDP